MSNVADQTATWEARVEGSRDTLTELAKHLTGHDPTLIERAGGFWLTTSRFEQLNDAATIRIEAEQIATTLSSLARLWLGSDGSLQVATIRRNLPDGRSDVFIGVRAGSINIRDRVFAALVNADGTLETPPPDPAIRNRCARALSDPDVAKALRLWDSGDRSWTALYRLYEVVEGAFGGRKAVISQCGVSDNVIERFKHTADSVTAAGDDARHGRERTDPPRNPMTLHDARAFVETLLKVWIE